MIRLAGKQPGRDIAIVYTGLRPGEKLHETLFHADERYARPRTRRSCRPSRASVSPTPMRERARAAARGLRRATTSKRWRSCCAARCPNSAGRCTTAGTRRPPPSWPFPPATHAGSDDRVSERIRKAVFPVAGLGTRFLPATKTVPKEMLPIIDRPLIQYAVDEAIEAGCDTLVFVTNRYKHAVADYFDKAYELEQKLEQAGKSELLELIRDVLPPDVRAVFVTQAEALGLGHAVLCAKPVVGDEPFAVLLPDDLIWNRGPGALTQMADLAGANRRQRDRGAGRAARPDQQLRHRRHRRRSPAAMARITRDRREAQARGRAEHARRGRPLRARPRASSTCSRQTHARRRRRDPAHRRHRRAAEARSAVYAYRFQGTRFDCGSHIGLIEATIRYALDHEKLSEAAARTMQKALDELGVSNSSSAGRGGGMPTPVAASPIGDVLIAIAQIGVALAGFSG